MNDWYARKLAQIQGQPAAPVAQPQQPQPLLPGQLPAHLAPYASPPVQPQQAAPQTPQAFVGAQPGQVPQQFTSYDAQTGAQVADDGTIAALYNSAAQTGGSKVVKENSSICPECNGGNYFTIPGGGVMNREGHRVQAQQCADCGYPKTQAGSHGGALQTARSQGPARPARQLPANHRVTIAVEGGGTATFEPPTGAR